MRLVQLRTQRLGVCGPSHLRHPPLGSVGTQQPVRAEDLQRADQQAAMARQDPQACDQLLRIEPVVQLQRHTKPSEGLQDVLLRQLIQLAQLHSGSRFCAHLFVLLR